ncbi:ESX secretion-associated protein EspG [Nocardia sp. NBC_00508]|uniref:ESX secretion-associated protein EspG n=1 Tax=Nocardia sp. NBC_00508 TaxID=2975992 RepID=UPI002E80077A|nr:ESX secretion-associated protein EspG [Nocardia sp. NBC_00508]WUD64338.1 ESX secretion-associated protein EspG [Nocardia sp. NBC_00508]
MGRVRVNWTLTPDQFALAWSRTDGDRIPYPLAVRLSARDAGERAAQQPALEHWCDQVLDADLEAALRVLAQPDLRIEVFGQRDPAPAPHTCAPREDGGPLTPPPASATDGDAPGAAARPVRILGAVSGNVAVVAAQRPGATPDRGGDVRLFVGGSKSLCARVVSMLPENAPGNLPRLTAPLAQVGQDSRNLVTVPVAGPSTPARIRRLLKQPREGIGQIVVSARRGAGEPRPFGVLCWIDVVADGRYAVRTGTDVDIVAVTAERFAAQLRPLVTAAARTSTAYAQR